MKKIEVIQVAIAIKFSNKATIQANSFKGKDMIVTMSKKAPQRNAEDLSIILMSLLKQLEEIKYEK